MNNESELKSRVSQPSAASLQ